jgi:hypothetical protein
MIHRMHVYCLVLLLSLVFATVGCSKKEQPQQVQDYNSIRADLRAQVEQGQLTREEAIVKLAEAQAHKKSYAGKKKKKRLSPKLEALGKDLIEQVEKGDMTKEEAKAAWMKAAGKTKSGAKTRNTKESTEEKK